jgi:hypothetical protein
LEVGGKSKGTQKTVQLEVHQLQGGGGVRLACFKCGKCVSNEIPDDAVIRAILTCPECIKGDQKTPDQEHLTETELLETARWMRSGKEEF